MKRQWYQAVKNKIAQRCVRSRAGMTLTEMLAAVLILAMSAVAVAGGVTVEGSTVGVESVHPPTRSATLIPPAAHRLRCPRACICPPDRTRPLRAVRLRAYAGARRALDRLHAVRSVGAARPGCVPEHAQRCRAAGVVPHARGHVDSRRPPLESWRVSSMRWGAWMTCTRRWSRTMTS